MTVPSDSEIIQRAYELELIKLYGTLVESMILGDVTGAVGRFNAGYRVIRRARIIAVDQLTSAPVPTPDAPSDHA